MKNFLQISIFIITFVFIQGCKKDDNPVDANPAPSTASNILPLHEGNKWIYSITHYDMLGNALGSHYDTLIVGKSIVKADETWYYSWNPSQYLTNRSTGLYLIDSSSYPVSSYLALMYPASAGDNWTYNPRSGAVVQNTVASASASVSVPAGTFNCYKYHVETTPKTYYGYEEEYVAPGIGLVQIITYSPKAADSTYYMTTKQALISYSLK